MVGENISLRPRSKFKAPMEMIRLNSTSTDGIHNVKTEEKSLKTYSVMK